jgi:hypothetical protein
MFESTLRGLAVCLLISANVGVSHLKIENFIMISELLCQQTHPLLKHKMLQLTLKISLYMGSYMFRSVRTIVREHMPDLAKVKVFVELLVKIHR